MRQNRSFLTRVQWSILVPVNPATTDRIIRIAALVLVLGLLTFFALRPLRMGKGPNYCPTDGHAAEWTHRLGETCEYGHFSVAERTAHTWTEKCP